eukprot:jgi/Chrzof1/4641/Cz14g21040.t1
MSATAMLRQALRTSIVPLGNQWAIPGSIVSSTLCGLHRAKDSVLAQGRVYTTEIDIDKHEALHMTGMPDSEAAKFEGAAKTGMQDLPIGSTRPDGGDTPPGAERTPGPDNAGVVKKPGGQQQVPEMPSQPLQKPSADKPEGQQNPNNIPFWGS